MSTVPVRIEWEDEVHRPREFAVGTLGWTADDLDDPEIERQWDEGSYEIVEGVLTRMAAAHFDGGNSLFRLGMIIQSHVDAAGTGGEFAVETDLVLEQMRVPRVDGMYLTADELRRQEALNAASRRPRGKYGRVRVVPTLIVEAISLGHEAHDKKTKRRWYAEAGVPHYWMLDAYAKLLECFVVQGPDYRSEQVGRGTDEVKPSLFPGLVIPLARVWR